jgi:predicted secreted Zn-dependent protease
LKLDIIVNCFFIPEKSWVRPGKLNEELLSHEQVHFDIAYLVSREFRDSLLSYKFSRGNFKEEIEQLKTKSANEYEEMQLQYDEETNHGRKREKQNLWKRKIESALQSTPQGNLFKIKSSRQRREPPDLMI